MITYIILGVSFIIFLYLLLFGGDFIKGLLATPSDKHLSPEYKLNTKKRIIKNGLGEHTAQWLKGKEWIDIEDYDSGMSYLMLHSRNFGENERPKFKSKEHAESLIKKFNDLYEYQIKSNQVEVVVSDYDSEIGIEKKIQEVLEYINNKSFDKNLGEGVDNTTEISYVDGELKIGSSCGREINTHPDLGGYREIKDPLDDLLCRVSC